MTFQLMAKMTWSNVVQREHYLDEVARYDDLLEIYREDTHRYLQGIYEPSGWMAWYHRQRMEIRLYVMIGTTTGTRTFSYDRVN